MSGNNHPSAIEIQVRTTTYMFTRDTYKVAVTNQQNIVDQLK